MNLHVRVFIHVHFAGMDYLVIFERQVVVHDADVRCGGVLRFHPARIAFVRVAQPGDAMRYAFVAVRAVVRCVVHHPHLWVGALAHGVFGDALQLLCPSPVGVNDGGARRRSCRAFLVN
jgi:hypothetical protein